MDYHIDNAKSVLKKNGKSFYWAGKLLTKEYFNRAAELYSFCKNTKSALKPCEPSADLRFFYEKCFFF